WWGAVANLKFDFNNAANADIRIAFDPDDGAWSYLGTDCKSIPVNQPTMNLGFLDGGTAAHEFGHAIGLAHEHQNPSGGIEWNEAVVISELAKSPNFWDEQTARHNVIRKYTANQINGTEFDPDSIMLYFFPASWTLNGIATKANDVLSKIDKQFIAGAKMYPKTGGTTSTAVELEVNAARRTAAAIGKVGEEDLYRFTAPRDGRYLIDTRGPTDVVMKLFGPNSETALIAEDDDSGIDTNALIVRDLLAGNYFVQVRHYNRANGMGNYTIKVRRT
ncbi:MAG: M12 family metallopeptidase, partial [Candidatus Binatia bacterium]